MKTALVLFALTGFSVMAQPYVAWVVEHRHLHYETIHQTMDEAGNLHVTAATDSGTNSDIITIKIDPNGQVLWQRQFDGFGSWDGPAGLAVDGDGNVCVAGITTFTPFDRDMVTLKYDAAGKLLWAKMFATPALRDDFPAAIATDSQGAVVVVGTEAANGRGRALVIKYDVSGNELWGQHCVSTDSDGTGVAVAEDGSVVCAAYAGFFYDDWVIVKYGPAGNELWRARRAGGGPAADFALNRGNVYVAAYGSPGPIKLDENGRVVWQAAGPGIHQFTRFGFDQNGDVYLGGISPGEDDALFGVLKYNRNGRPKYSTGFIGAFTWGQGFAVDWRGNSYLTTGVFDAAVFRKDALLKLNPQGEQQWQWSFPDSLPRSEFPEMIRVSVDRAGDVFVTGTRATVKLVNQAGQ
jgi:hypothetical protein